MILPLALALVIHQGPSDVAGVAADVERLVAQGRYVEAVSAARALQGEEGASLEVWARHHAGDLSGALDLAERALLDSPQHVALLEQAAYLSASLLRGPESLSYTKRLSKLEHPNAAVLEADAQALMHRDAEVARGRGLAISLVAAFTLLAGGLALWGARPASG